MVDEFVYWRNLPIYCLTSNRAAGLPVARPVHTRGERMLEQEGERDRGGGSGDRPKSQRRFRPEQRPELTRKK